MTNGSAVISVDFELFTHLPAYRRASGRLSETTVGLSAMDDLLALFADHDATTTFFVVSEIAENHPEPVRRAADEGHEIASHTHTHRHLSALAVAERDDELRSSRETLERVTGTSVDGFRAPSFDTTPDLFESLEAAGYAYDSSVVPCRSIPGWYGGEHTEQRPVPTSRLPGAGAADLGELPVAVMPGLRLPLSGTWLRFFGVRYTILGMRLLARRDIAPVLYVHPWELVDLPRVEGVAKRVYWRTGPWMRRALDRILSESFEFVPARSVLERAGVIG